MKSKGKKSAVNFCTAVLYKIIVIAVGLLLPKLFISNYGSEINGLQTSVKQIFTYIALLEAGVGASTLQSLYRPVAQKNREQVNGYLSAASSYYNKIGVLYFIALFIIAAIYSFAVEVDSATRLEVLFYIVVSGALTGLNFFYVAKIKLLISAEGDQYLVSLVTTAVYVLSSIAKIILVYYGIHIIFVELAYLFINITATMVYYFVAKRKYPWLNFKSKPDFSCTEQKNSVLVHRISSVIFQNVDIMILTFVCDLRTVSIYSMYKMVVGMVTSIVSEIGGSVNFAFGQKFNLESDENKPQYRLTIDTFNVYYSAIAFALYNVTFLLILPFLELYTDGMDINYIYKLLPFLYVAMEFLMVGREAMMRTIEVAGHFKKTQNKTITETVINVVASLIFTFVFKEKFGMAAGIYGVLLGTVVALLYRTVDINIYANRKILNRGSGKTFFVMLVNMALFAALFFVFGNINLRFDNYFDFVLNACWITPMILLLYLSVHSLLNRKEFMKIYSTIKKN